MGKGRGKDKWKIKLKGERGNSVAK